MNERIGLAVAEAGVHLEEHADQLPLGSWQRRVLERAAEHLGELSEAIEAGDEARAVLICPER